ncbi:EI24 domain-containing protein [Armatimonas sp.]|uniref:EI24 domain-containing protein n=1 Tax=Armatimonas sp. TaxID=1872638 RepID=UPI00286B5DB4|nr:EI24 domain-containing protein [Armatimonas sp.]
MDALKGIGFLLKHPRLWPLALVPGLIASVLYVILGWIGWQRYGAGLEEGARVAAFLLYLVLFPFAFYLLGSSFLGLVFDPLSRETERLLGAEVPVCPLNFWQLFGDTCKRLLLNGGICLLAFGLGAAVGPVAGVLGAGLVSLLDYTSPAFLRRGTTLRVQMRLLLKKPDVYTLTFAVAAGLLSLVPFLGLFLAPSFIVGGVFLARRRLQ